MACKKGVKHTKPHEESPKFPEYYKKLNPDWSDEKCQEEATKFKKSSNWQCIEYYERMYPELSHEEHLRMKEEKRKSRQANSPFDVRYWENKYPNKSKEDIVKIFEQYKKENSFQCIEYYEKRFPDATHEEHEQMLKNAIEKYLEKRPDNSGENNPMHRSKRTEQQRKESSSMSIEYYKKRFPNISEEEQIKLLIEQQNKITQKSKSALQPTQIQYYINQGYDIETARIKLSERQSTFSLKKCIKKYGREEGLRIFIERQQKWKQSLNKNFIKNGDGRSPQSRFAKTLIRQICNFMGEEVPIKEKYIHDVVTNRNYAYDFCFENKIIEFNGDYWHCNPNIYEKDYINKRTLKTASQTWEYDKKKKECAEKYGYKVLYIWESEYKENKKKAFQKCIQFILS